MEKKLKRGLKDISALFGTPAFENTTDPLSADTQILTVCHTLHPKDSLNWNMFIAKRLVGEMGRRVSCISIEAFREILGAERFKKGFNGVQTSLEVLIKTPSELPLLAAASDFLFLDFDFSFWNLWPYFLPSLNKMIVIVQRDIYSLLEAYRLVKILTQINPVAETYIMAENLREDSSEDIIGERVSDYFSRRLSRQIQPMGSIDPFNSRDQVRLPSLTKETLPRHPPSSQLAWWKAFSKGKTPSCGLSPWDSELDFSLSREDIRFLLNILN